MTQRIYEEYYEMGAGLLHGIIVDVELKEKLQEVLDKANDEIQQLINDNMEHVLVSSSSIVYPRGKYTSFRYIEEKPYLDVSRRLKMFDSTLDMNKVEYLFKTDEDWENIDRLKAFAQRNIEDELDAKEKEVNHE